MELILKSGNEQSIAKILALAKKLHVIVEQRGVSTNDSNRETLKKRILNFKSDTPSPFGDAAVWEREERADRELPLP